MTISTELGEESLSELEGLHEDNKTTLEDLKESLDKILEVITGISSNKQDQIDFINDMGDNVKKTVGNEDGKETDTEDPKSKSSADKPKIGIDIKPNDLSNLPAKFVMGALLVNSTLVQMQKSLNSILQYIASGKKEGSKQKDKPEDTKPTSKSELFSMDSKTISEMGKSLLEFAKACIILALVPTKLAESGLKLFESFIVKMKDCASTLSKGQGKEFLDMSKAIVTIIGALKQYAVAVILLALVLPFSPFALLSIAMMTIMLRMITTVGKMSKDAQNAIATLGRTMIQLGFAMILYGIALSIIIHVGKQAVDALKGVLVLISFMGLMILLGLVCVLAGPALVAATGVFIQLSIAAILFGVAVNIMSKIQVDQKVITNFMTAVTTVVQGFASIAKTIAFGVLAAFGFVLFASLLFAGLLLFTLDALLMLAVTAILDRGDLMQEIEIDGQKILGFKAISYISVIAKQMWDGTLGFLKGLVAAIAMVLFTAFLTVGLILFTIDALLLFVIDKLLGDMMIESPDDKNVLICRPLKNISGIAKQMALNIGTFALGAGAAIIAAVFAGAFAIFAIAALIGVVALVEVKKNIDKIGTPKELNLLGRQLKEAIMGVMLGFCGINTDPDKDYNAVDIIKAVASTVAMGLLAATLLAVIVPVSTFMLSAVIIVQSLLKLNESMKDINPELINNVFSGLGSIMSHLSDFAGSMKGTSAKTITAIGGLVKDVAEAINMLTDIVIKLKDGIPDDQIEAATHTMLNLCEKLFGTPGMSNKEKGYTLTSTLETIANADLKNLNAEAVGAIAPLMEGIDKMVDLVMKISDPSTFSEDAINTGIENLKRFTSGMMIVTEAMQYLITAKDTGATERRGGLLGLLGVEKSVMKSPLDAVNDVLNSGFFGSLNTVFSQIGNTLNTLQGIDPTTLQPMTDFLASGTIDVLSTQSPKFVTGMSNFATGIGKLKPNDIENFKNFLDAFSSSNASNIQSVAKSLTELGNASAKFKSIADSFERIEKALKKIANTDAGGGISGVFNSIKSKFDKGATDIEQSTTSAIGGPTVNPYVEKIYNVIDDWNTNGVPLRGKVDKESGEIQPMEVGNTTGIGANRQ